MKVLSLKVKDDIFKEVEHVVRQVHTSRNAYINQALHFYNMFNKRRLLKKKLHEESKAVRTVSLEVLHEMEQIEDDLVS